MIIAARPAMGKTAFVLSMAKNIAVDFKIPVAIFSLEMSNVQLVNRLIMNVCEIEGDKIKNGRLTKQEWNKMESKINELMGAPIYIDDTPGLSIFELQSKARKLVREKGVELIIIDYLQLMTGSTDSKGNREQEVAFISRTLKAIAKELNVPIIALSQLSRNTESRGGTKRPQLSDLRESGAIEQDADVVAFIHRPEYYGFTETEDHKSTDGIAEIIIAKHRNGEVTDVRMRFIKEQARFANLEMMAQGEQYSNFDSSMNSTVAGGGMGISPLQGMTGADEFSIGAPTPRVPVAPIDDEAPF